MNRNVLIVDDERGIRDYVKSALEIGKFNVYEAADALEAIDIIEESSIDIAVVDVMMPGKDGFDLCREIKEDYSLPVIMLTARSELNDKRKAFLAGTDDYVTKPFEVEELLFRIEAILNRYDKGVTQIQIGNLTMEPEQFEIIIDEQVLFLPRKEFELLYALGKHYPNVATRDSLIEEVWGYDYEGDERTVDVHVKRLRKRLSAFNSNIEIMTVRGVGYRIHEL